MENNIKFKTFKYINMKKTFILIMLLIFSMPFIFGQTQNIVSKYDFEEGSGSIAFDSSGNNLNGIITGATYVTDSAFGDYAMSFATEGNQFYEISIPVSFSSSFCTGGWLKPTIDYGENTLIDMQNGVINKFQLYYNQNNMYMRYRDDSGVLRVMTLGTGSLAWGVWQHTYTCINGATEQFEFYYNSNLVNSGTITGGYKLFTNLSKIRIGASLTNSYQTGKLMDALITTDSFPSEEDIIQLYQFNTIDTPNGNGGGNETEPELTGTQEVNLINNFHPSPNTELITSNKILINLNTMATCEMYVNNQLYKIGNGKVSYSFAHDLQVGEYTGTIYCYYDSQGIRYYELTSKYNFLVTLGSPSEINFIIHGSDYNPDNYNIYISTPCPKAYTGSSLLGDDILNELNKGETYYIQKLSNSMASFNVYSGNHEFCLINGHIQYSENNYTTSHNINKIYGMINLGKFEVANNVTSSYQIITETFDIFGKTNPKAWGQTWSSIIGAFILLLLGAGTLIVGVMTGNGKIVIAGALIVLSAMGVGFTGFVGLIV